MGVAGLGQAIAGARATGRGRWARKRRTCHLRIHFGENPASTYFAYLFNLHISVSDDFHLRLCMRTMVIYYAIYRNKTKRLKKSENEQYFKNTFTPIVLANCTKPFISFNVTIIIS